MKSQHVFMQVLGLIGCLFFVGQAAAEPRPTLEASQITRPAPQPQEIDKELNALLRQLETSMYASNSIGDNGMATGNADPILMKIMQENLLEYKVVATLPEKDLAYRK